MQALTDERWNEIRSYSQLAEYDDWSAHMLKEVLKQHDHLAAQIKLLEDYIMSERPDDPAWSMGEGACAMAVEIMKREMNEISHLKFDLSAKSLSNASLKLKLNNANS